MLDMGVVPSDERTMKTTPRERKNKPIVKITYLNASDFIEKPFFLPLQRYEIFFRGEVRGTKFFLGGRFWGLFCLFGFLGAAADDEAEGEAYGVVVLARNLALKAKAYMIYEFDTYAGLDGKTGISETVAVQYGDTGGKAEKWINFAALSKIIV